MGISLTHCQVHLSYSTSNNYKKWHKKLGKISETLYLTQQNKLISGSIVYSIRIWIPWFPHKLYWLTACTENRCSFRKVFEILGIPFQWNITLLAEHLINLVIIRKKISHLLLVYDYFHFVSYLTIHTYIILFHLFFDCH